MWKLSRYDFLMMFIMIWFCINLLLVQLKLLYFLHLKKVIFRNANVCSFLIIQKIITWKSLSKMYLCQKSLRLKRSFFLERVCGGRGAPNINCAEKSLSPEKSFYSVLECSNLGASRSLIQTNFYKKNIHPNFCKLADPA